MYFWIIPLKVLKQYIIIKSILINDNYSEWSNNFTGLITLSPVFLSSKVGHPNMKYKLIGQ